MNKTFLKQQKKRIDPYSDINKRAKFLLPYSILNPETNSDSHSAKSKGGRLVSARITTNQMKNKYKLTKIVDILFIFIINILDKL